MDVAGFDRFYTATALPLTRQLFLILGDMAEAQHAIHVAYARAWKAWPRVGALPAPEAWIRATAAEVALRPHRRLLRQLRGRREIPVEALVYAARHEAVVAALARLPEPQRCALVLHYVADLDLAGVAAQTHWTTAVAAQALAGGRAGLAALLPHLLESPAPAPDPAAPDPAAPDPAAPDPAAPDPAERPVAPAGDERAVRRYLAEAAERRRPLLLPAADVRNRIWRRGYYAAGAAVTLAVGGLVGAGAALDAVASHPGRSRIHQAPTAAHRIAVPPGSEQDGATPGAGSGSAAAGSDFPLGRSTAGAAEIPRNRRDLGYLDSWYRRDGGTFLRLDRVRLRGDGSIDNASTRLRDLPLAPAVTVRGGKALPALLGMGELVRLLDDGALRGVVFVLHYDEAGQVDQISELLHR